MNEGQAMKQWIFYLWLGIGLLAVHPIQAQASGWLAWLYDPGSGTLTQVAENGTVLDTYVLPMPPGYDAYPQQVAIAPSGSPVAYVPYNRMTFESVLVLAVRDQIAYQDDLPPILAESTEFIGGSVLFNETGTQFALGYALEEGGWTIRVLDLLANQISYSLSSNNAVVAPLGLPSGVGQTPVIRRFNGTTVTFNLAEAGSSQTQFETAYDWNAQGDVITANPSFRSLYGDVFPLTGEVINAQQDQRLEGNFGRFDMGQLNALQVLVPQTGALFPFYNTPAATISTSRFFQNGEQIAFRILDTAGLESWIAIGRGGQQTGVLQIAPDSQDVQGVRDGLIFTTQRFVQDATTLIYIQTRDGLDAGVPIWTSPAGAVPQIVWTGHTDFVAQSAYSAWVQLADPVFTAASNAIAPAPNQPLLTDPQPTLPGSPALIGSTTLTVGGQALVQTTEGSQLNIRIEPGVAFQIVAKLGAGARVTLLEGPESVDGFIWWRIQTDSGITGWAVESVEDEDGSRLQTLIPA
jgi:hypothetical protein